MVYVCVCVYIYIYIYVCVCVCVCVYIHIVLVVKNPPANAGKHKRPRFDLGWEDPLEKEMAANSSFLA